MLTITLITEGSKEDNRTKVAPLGCDIHLLLQQKREVAEAYLAYGTPGAVLVRTDGTIGSPLTQGADEIRALVAHLGAGAPPTARVEPLAIYQGGQNGAGQAPKPHKPILSSGAPAPTLTFKDLNGKTVSLATFRGAETLLLFWNPECGYCQRMLSDLKSWETARPARAPKLLVISTGMLEVNLAMALRSPVVLDENFRAGATFGANGTPSAVLLDAKGRVASEIAAGAQAVFALANAKSRDVSTSA
jgi:peroxiredoxin